MRSVSVAVYTASWLCQSAYAGLFAGSGISDNDIIRNLQSRKDLLTPKSTQITDDILTMVKRHTYI